MYTSPASLKLPPWKAESTTVDARRITWEEFKELMDDKTAEEAAIAAGLPVPAPRARRRLVAVEPMPYWLGARYAPANDNNPARRWTGEENYGPDADHNARQANPGTTRDYEGDILSRLVSDGNIEAAYVLRVVGQLLAPISLSAANDNLAEDADNEMRDGFYGLDYSMEQDKAEKVIEAYDESGKVPGGCFRFRQRSGAGGCRLTARHRKEIRDGLHFDRYLVLRGVADLPPQEYHSDGVPWRSHAPRNAAAAKELAAACERTDWHRVTWIRYPPMGARVYGDLAIFSTTKGTGEGGATAPEHNVSHEIRRGQTGGEFRKRMSERNLRLVEAAIARNSYTQIATAEGISRNGAKGAIVVALKEAWGVITSITGEKMPDKKEIEEKLAA